MFLFMNTSCQKGVQRASARHGGIFGSVDFNVLGNFAELVSEFESHADIVVFVNLDVGHKFNKNFPVECFKILVFHKGHQSGMLVVNAVCQFRPLGSQSGQYIREGCNLPLIVGFYIPVVLLGNFPSFSTLDKGNVYIG